MATITTAQIAAVLKAADPLNDLSAKEAKIVGSTALLNDLHDLSVSTTVSDFEKIVKRVAEAVKKAKVVSSDAARNAAAKDEITFANSGVKALCKPDVMTKLISIQRAGTNETGHGKVPFLKDALHAHVTNTLGVAWNWVSGHVHVVAVGKKNNQNKVQDGKKTMEYDWDTK
jgi:hypothetical protein